MDIVDLSSGSWINPPPKWSIERNCLKVESAEKTDFWRHSHYRFVHDNGHALMFRAPIEFSATLTFTGDYQQNYDHAGFLLRADSETWVKMGIEFVAGSASFAVVVTLGKSDWSIYRIPLISGPQTIRVSRTGDSVIVHVLQEGQWQLIRVAAFPELVVADLGLMVCSPERQAFCVTFADFRLGSAIDNPLYGQSG